MTFTMLERKTSPLVGSNRNARRFLTLNSRARSSVVPTKSKPGVVAVLPPSFQALLNAAVGTVPLASWSALRAVRPVPLPVCVPAKVLCALVKLTAPEYVPERLPPGTTPVTFEAVTA